MPSPVCLTDKGEEGRVISVTKLEALSGFSLLSSRDRLASNLDFVSQIMP